jgi:hypothetical protein
MPSYSKSTPEILLRRLHELREELEATAPALLAEIRLVEGLLKMINTGPMATYSTARTPRDAIETCLNMSGDFKLTKKEIIHAILAGGYVTTKPKAARGLLNDSLNHYIRKGRLILKDDLVGHPTPNGHHPNNSSSASD